jgi:hypothetical protein
LLHSKSTKLKVGRPKLAGIHDCIFSHKTYEGFPSNVWLPALVGGTVSYWLNQSPTSFPPFIISILNRFPVRFLFLLLASWGGVGLSPLSTLATNWPIVPAPDDRWAWNSWWNENWQRISKYFKKTCPSATLSTTNPTWPGLGWNPGCHGGKLVTKSLSYGMVSPERLTLLPWRWRQQVPLKLWHLTTRLQSPTAEYCNLHVGCCENLKSQFIHCPLHNLRGEWNVATCSQTGCPTKRGWYRLKQNVLCCRQCALLVYLMSLVGVLAFMFTLTVGHIWPSYLTGGLFG